MGCILQEGKQTSYLKAETAVLGPFVTVGVGFISAKEVIWERGRVPLYQTQEGRQQHLSLPAATDASDKLPGVFDGAADALAEHKARVHRPELVVDRGPANYVRVRRLPHPLRHSESEWH